MDGRVRAPGGKGAPIAEGKPGWQSDGSYLTPEGRATAPAMSSGRRTCARCRTGSSGRSSRACKGVAGVDAIGGYVKQYHVAARPDEARRAWPLLRRRRRGAGSATISAPAPATSSATAKPTWCAPTGRIESSREIGDVVVATRERRAGPCQGCCRGRDRP